MNALYDVCAPAKLNLFLHITGRRPDGYHLLQSVFMLIDWCDTLHFEMRHDGKISREDLADAAPTGACANAASGIAIDSGANPSQTSPLLPANDLCVRAALALQNEAAGLLGHGAAGKMGVHIGLVKNIPTQAGMGGGSSDAASTLLALNRLWGLDFPLPQLMRIALPLGADVPFFLGSGNAWVEGIGEKITPLVIPPARFVVAKPPHGLDTALIFAHPLLPRATETAIISGFAANPFGFGKNDLQGVARQLCPGVDQGLQWLETLKLAARMTGSGSAVFAALPKNRPSSFGDEMGDGDKSLQSRAPVGFRVRVCRNLSVHPLAGWASS